MHANHGQARGNMALLRSGWKRESHHMEGAVAPGGGGGYPPVPCGTQLQLAISSGRLHKCQVVTTAPSLLGSCHGPWAS